MVSSNIDLLLSEIHIIADSVMGGQISKHCLKNQNCCHGVEAGGLLFIFSKIGKIFEVLYSMLWLHFNGELAYTLIFKFNVFYQCWMLNLFKYVCFPKKYLKSVTVHKALILVIFLKSVLVAFGFCFKMSFFISSGIRPCRRLVRAHQFFREEVLLQLQNRSVTVGEAQRVAGEVHGCFCK